MLCMSFDGHSIAELRLGLESMNQHLFLHFLLACSNILIPTPRGCCRAVENTLKVGASLVMSHRLEMHARPIQDSCSWFLSALRGQAARHRCVWVLLASLLDPPEQRSRKRLCVEPACFTRQLQEQDFTQNS